MYQNGASLSVGLHLPPTIEKLGIFFMHYSTLANSIKQSTQLGGKRKDKERGPKSKPKE